MQCDHCGATLVVGCLAESHAAVKDLGSGTARAPAQARSARARAPALSLGGRSAAPARLVRDMEASARPPPDAPDDDPLQALFEDPTRVRWVSWLKWGAVALLLALWFGAFH